MVPLLKNTNAEWSHYARTSFGPGNYSITSEDYRFIQYKDGSEEFYNHKIDPQEWHSDIDNSKYSEVIEKHRAEIPNGQYEILGQGSTGHLSYEASDKNSKNFSEIKLIIESIASIRDPKIKGKALTRVKELIKPIKKEASLLENGLNDNLKIFIQFFWSSQ